MPPQVQSKSLLSGEIIFSTDSTQVLNASVSSGLLL